MVTTVPAEVVRRLSLQSGQELEWIEDGMGGFRVVPRSDDLADATDALDRAMAKYDAVFRKLAQ
jgi:bifunctional DNA-binding transcriptional regulator/antitoxin component of YhaV-PrlF toxin-antitoxin module